MEGEAQKARYITVGRAPQLCRQLPCKYCSESNEGNAWKKGGEGGQYIHYECMKYYVDTCQSKKLNGIIADCK